MELNNHFLKKAVDSLNYKTPSKILQYVKKHKYDFLIKNPPIKNL